MPSSEGIGPLIVEVDIPITRRMKLHAVVKADGEQIYHSKRLSQVFQWMLDNEHTDFTMIDEDSEFRVSLQPPLPPLTKEKG